MIKMSKSAFGLVSAVIVCGMSLCLSPVQGTDKPWEPTGKETPASMKARTSTINRPKEVGKYYEATVPDTLDLAERAWLGINHFTSIVSEDYDYEMYGRADFDKSGGSSAWPGYMVFECSQISGCQAKCMEAMAMERLMSGSQQHLEREARMLEMMVSLLGEDGLHYNVPPSGGRKPWLGPEEYRPFAYVHGQARMMRAMIRWYQYTGDPVWKERIDRMVDGFDRLLVAHKDDYAYIPLGGWLPGPDFYYTSSYLKGRGWKDTTEPVDEKRGDEASLFCQQGHFAGVLANWYVLSGNEQALRLSGQMTRFLTKPKFWADWPGGEYPGVVGAEHAHWRGHFHGYMCALRSILEYAETVNDSRLKLFAQEGYEWARQAGLARIGLVGDGQGCGLARMIGLAIKLTDAGLGDYWEDVDLYIRNQGTEMQFTPEDIPHVQKLIEKNPNAPPPRERNTEHPTGTNVGVIEAAMGAVAAQPSKGVWFSCCTGWGNQGLFYAWEGTLRYADGVARVNLLLNRASLWMDVDSYLPYEGKVVLRNKAAREAFVRIPLWVDMKAVGCRIGDQIVRLEWFGNYLRFRDLRVGDVVTIEFPVAKRIERWTLQPKEHFLIWQLPGGTTHTIKFKGNTVVELSPPLRPGFWVYQDRAEKYKLAKAPVKNVTRYVTPQTLKW